MNSKSCKRLSPTYFLLLVSSFLLFPLQPTAASETTPDEHVEQINQLTLPPSSGNAPAGRSAGGARDDCPVSTPAMTALVPDAYGLGGYTSSARPTLWVYLPYTLNTVAIDPNSSSTPLFNSARLEIDSITEELEEYETVVEGSLLEPGIVSLTLPESVSELSIGDELRWTLLLYCGDRHHTGLPLTVSGWITRIESGSVPEEDIWYDRLTVVGTAFRNDPANRALANQWAELMQGVDVDGIVDQPIQDCCTLERR